MDEKTDLRMIDPKSMNDNVFKLIGDDWMLITAGRSTKFNTMTASWGGMGILWGRNVCFCFVRPTRYTYEFTENADMFTLCFFGGEYRDALNYCGSHSGRDVDKMSVTGLSPISDEDDCIYFKESRIVIKCRKLYTHDLDPTAFLDPEINLNYAAKDYHRMYIGEIESCLVR